MQFRFSFRPVLCLIALSLILPTAARSQSKLPEINVQTSTSQGVTALAISPDGRTALAGGFDGIARLWDLQTGRLVRSFGEQQQFGKMPVAFSPDGKSVLTGSADAATLWDVETGRKLREVKTDAEKDAMGFAAFSPDGHIMAAGREWHAWDAQSGATLMKEGDGEKANLWIEGAAWGDATFSPDGRTVATGGTLWNVATGKKIREVGGDWNRSSAPVFARDGKSLLFAGDNVVRQWDIASGKLSRRFVGHAEDINSVAISPDGRTLVTASGGRGGYYPSSDNSVRLWDMATGRELRKLFMHRSKVNAAVFTSNGADILSGGSDGSLKLVNAKTGELIATMVAVDATEWVVLTPEGYFDASSPNAMRRLNYRRGTEIISIDQFRDALFRPDLVKAKLAGDIDGPVKAAASRLDLTTVVDSGNPPSVAITSPADGSNAASGEINVEATVTEKGGGIGRIEWRLNGQSVGIETRGFIRVPDSAPATSNANTTTADAATRISHRMVLDAGDNVIEVLAYNSKGLVASQPSKITIKAAAPRAPAKPRLFVLAIGVNDYYDGRLKLNYAVADARSIAASFEGGGKGFYDSVRATTALDADVTRASLEKIFAGLASEVKPTDVFVLFVAGHGRTLDGHYYFLPQDFRYRDQGSFADNGLSQEQWQKWMALIQARKSVLIYDTCESGSLASDNLVVAARGTQAIEEQAVAYQKLGEATGKTILAASTDTQPALEGYRGHGLFSYVVMEALEKAQTNASGLIEVTGLISYVDDKVPDISDQVFHRRQIPQIKMLGSNFAIARPTAMAAVMSTEAAAAGRKAPAQVSAPVSAKPTHVIIAPSSVFDSASSRGAVVKKLPAGTQVTVIETSSGWTVVARDGQRLGYVEAGQLAPLQ